MNCAVFAKLYLTLVSLILGSGCIGNIYPAEDCSAIVKTPAGRFRGTIEKTRDGNDYNYFRSVPFAEPPVRFQAPVPKAKVTGTYDTQRNQTICAQIPTGTTAVVGGEDCLYLSVSFPSKKRCLHEPNPDKLPVLFWIFGGGFKVGNQYKYPPPYLLDRCVVLVVPNYRLGVLGFLTTGDNVIPGNLGLKDQLLALKWVQTNIGAFRGDAGRITIFGESAEGGSVGHHICSPASKRLFHRAISMSGTILNPTSMISRPKSIALMLGASLKCPNSTKSVDLLNCLKNRDVVDIVTEQETFVLHSDNLFLPVIEPTNAITPFQTRNPRELFKLGEINRVPYIVGFMEDEGVAFLPALLQEKDIVDGFYNDWRKSAPVFFLYDDVPEKKKNNISDSIREYYFNREKVNVTDQQDAFALLIADGFIITGVKIFGAICIRIPIFSLDRYENFTHGPVATHGDDFQYLFPQSYYVIEKGDDTYHFSEQFVELWTNFAKNGKPTGVATEKYPWDKVSGEPYQKVYELNLPTSIYSNYLKNMTEFWRSLGFGENELY